MLDTFQSALYQRLQVFELDDPTHDFGFTRHLMKSQGWTLTYTQRAIAEYKKFAFLTVVANHQVVPSDQVDQVWHSHILFTRSYWEEFCPNVLGKVLHHHPARGGRAERAEFHRLYAKTITSYRQFWGSPPTDIWSSPDVRFGAELKMQRVNLSDHWVIPKQFPRLKLAQPFSIIALIACMITIGCVHAAQGSPIQPMTDDNIPPVQFVNAALFGAPILGLVLRYVIQSPSQQPQKPRLNTYQIAYLAGGNVRAVELAITQLVHQGHLRPNVSNRTFAIEKPLPSEATCLEQQVMQQVVLTPDLKSLREANKYKTNFLREFLEREKLVLTGWAAIMGLGFVLFLLISLFGGLLMALSMAIPGIQSLYTSLYWNFFLVLYVSIGIFTLCSFVPSGRTRWGNLILADLKKNHNFYDVRHRFALYGYSALSGGALDDLNQMFTAQAEEDNQASGACGC
jgi:uncharacterized protein (TIGR04222 family)